MPKPMREMWMEQLNAHLPSSPSFQAKISKTQSRIQKGHSNTTTEWSTDYALPNCNMRMSKMATGTHIQLSVDSFHTFSIMQNHTKHSMD